MSAGGHLNPAVSLGFFIAGRVSFIRALMYTICQVLGAAVGAALIRAVSFFTSVSTLHYTPCLCGSRGLLYINIQIPGAAVWAHLTSAPWPTFMATSSWKASTAEALPVASDSLKGA